MEEPRSPEGKELKKTEGLARESQRQMVRGGAWSVNAAVSQKARELPGKLRDWIRRGGTSLSPAVQAKTYGFNSGKAAFLWEGER